MKIYIMEDMYVCYYVFINDAWLWNRVVVNLPGWLRIIVVDLSQYIVTAVPMALQNMWSVECEVWWVLVLPSGND